MPHDHHSLFAREPVNYPSSYNLPILLSQMIKGRGSYHQTRLSVVIQPRSRCADFEVDECGCQTLKEGWDRAGMSKIEWRFELVERRRSEIKGSVSPRCGDWKSAPRQVKRRIRSKSVARCPMGPQLQRCWIVLAGARWWWMEQIASFFRVWRDVWCRWMCVRRQRCRGEGNDETKDQVTRTSGKMIDSIHYSLDTGTNSSSWAWSLDC